MIKKTPFCVKLLAIFFTLLLLSCSSAEQVNETVYDRNAEIIDDSLTLLKKTQALASLMKLPYSLKYYDVESANAYTSIISEITYAFPYINTIEEAESYISRLQNVLDSMKLMSGDVPRVYITAESGISDAYRVADIIIDTQGNEYVNTTAAVIKLRGNSTRNAMKKPYTIKFENKVSLLGMEKSKKWVLLANAFDKTLLRNKIAFDFAQKLNFQYSPECEFVDVYLNGKYNGLYLLTEAINEGKNRVNIDIENGDFLFEHESDRNEAGKIYIETKEGMRLKVCEPKTFTVDQVISVRRYLMEIEQSIAECDYDEFSRYIDVPSFVDYYIIMEIFKDVDGWYSSVFFYLKNGVIHAGPVWDFDLSCGNASKAYDEDKYRSYWNVPDYGTGSGDSADGVWMQFGWFKLLMQNTRFKSMVRSRFLELQPYIINLYNDNEIGQNKIDSLKIEYREAIERNNVLWPVSQTQSIIEMKPLSDYTANIEYYRDWLNRRNKFLLGYFG